MLQLKAIDTGTFFWKRKLARLQYHYCFRQFLVKGFTQFELMMIMNLSYWLHTLNLLKRAFHFINIDNNKFRVAFYRRKLKSNKCSLLIFIISIIEVVLNYGIAYLCLSFELYQFLLETSFIHFVLVQLFHYWQKEWFWSTTHEIWYTPWMV